MRIWLAAPCALLVIAGRTHSQSTAVQDGGVCPTTTSPASSCEAMTGQGLAVADLSPTQWLFGRDQFTKLSHPRPDMVTLARTRSDWVLALDRASRGPRLPSSGPNQSRSESVPLATYATGSVRDPVTGKSGLATEARFLIEEWRRTELDVADSVHHANIERIFVTFDSVRQVDPREPAHREILMRLDRMNHSNDYSWLMFKAEINRRADSALASR